MGITITWRQATDEEISRGLDSEMEGMIKISEEEFNDFQADSIEEALTIKKDAIDKRTQELIFEGFIYDNLKWSLSINAQINWNNLPQMPEFAFPLNMQDMDGTDYVLSYEERMNFYYTAMAAKNTHLQSGNALKTQVSELTTIQEILTFKDPR